MNLESALQTFFAESRDLLAEMETELLAMSPGEQDPNTLNAIFRAAHTIKGSAGLFDLNAVVTFTHEVETLLDRIRSGELPCTDERIQLLLASRDYMSVLLEASETGGQADTQVAQDLFARLHDSLGCLEAPPACGSGSPAQKVGDNLPGGGLWHLSLRFGPDVLRDGMDPASFLQYLDTLGTIRQVVPFHTLPPVTELNPESCYLGLEVTLETEADRHTLEQVFEFVREESSIRLLAPGSEAGAFVELVRERGEPDEQLVEAMARSGALAGDTLAQVCRILGLAAPSSSCRAAEQTAPEAADTPPQAVKTDTGPGPQSASERQAPAQVGVTTAARPVGSGYVRVQAERLDALINLVGELVIASAASSLHAQKSPGRQLIESAALVSRLVEEIRDNALQLRMVPIGETFNRFRRVVHDVSRELGKDVQLAISGADTELDKTVVEKIGDPLTHLIRNALDHGIETAEQREKSGKPGGGSLRLNAFHESGSIIIEVADDGRGLDRGRILAKARAQALVGEADEPTDEEVWALIFAPGLSTAGTVSNLSGRGVGMDVVRRNIEALRGTVEVESTRGEGTVIRIRLPLTLAIIDGFLMGIGRARYVVPLDQVLLCEELSQADRQALARSGYLNLRGEALPVIRLRQRFEEPSEAPRRENVVVVQHGGLRFGLIVDALLGEHQTVIKPLGEMFEHLKGISGATILGSGEIALILDVQTLAQEAIGDREHWPSGTRTRHQAA